MASSHNSIEELFLKIFKATVLSIMGLALVAIIVLIAASSYLYFQPAKTPTPAQKYQTKEISADELKAFLIEEKKKENAEEDNVISEKKSYEKNKPLLFNEETLALYRCSDNFGKAVNASVAETDNQTKSQEVEFLRSRIEELASSDPSRGAPWVNAAVTFTCKTLSDKTIINLKKEGKIGAVFIPILNFHIRAWDKIQSDKLIFEQKEEARVTSELQAEELRISMAKASAISFIIGAAILLGLFLILSLYLLGARIEKNLSAINETLRDKATQIVN